MYVIAFFFLGSLFWMNLLASTVVEYYTKLVAEKGDVLTSKKQKVWETAVGCSSDSAGCSCRPKAQGRAAP